MDPLGESPDPSGATETISQPLSKAEDGAKQALRRRKILFQVPSALSGDVLSFYIESNAPDIEVEHVLELPDVKSRLAVGEYDCLMWRSNPADGIDLATIRSYARATPDLPIMVLTDMCDIALIRKADELGISAIVPTWSSGELLIGVIRLVLAGGIYRPYERQRGSMDLSQPAVAPLAIAGSGTGENADPRGGEAYRTLTRRQGDVWRLLAEGKSNKNIAAELGMRESTVKVHIKQIMKKLQVENRTQAALLAVRSGVVAPPSLRPR
ncbi:MAG: response regulator transcription factor [Proteobacteria bacterium]|nr:response regulator transcription factor [Pseudomonadota bacterium]